MRFTPYILLTLGSSLVLSACVTYPDVELGPGRDFYQLMQLIRSGAVKPNEYVQSHDEEKILPICAVARMTVASIPTAPMALDELLERGARLDLTCRPDGQNVRYFWRADQTYFPIDQLIESYVVHSRRSDPRYDPKVAADIKPRIERFAALGAKSDLGPDVSSSMRAMHAMHNETDRLVVEQQAIKEAEEQRERERSRESSATLAGLVAIAGLATNNYSALLAQRQANAGSNSLPIANVQTFKPSGQLTSPGPTHPAPRAQAPVQPTVTLPNRLLPAASQIGAAVTTTGNASTAPRYTCTNRKDFFGVSKGRGPAAYQNSCEDATDQANKFIASFNVSTPWHTAGNRKLINVEACRKHVLYEDNAVVFLNYSASEVAPCGPSRGVSR